MGAVAVPILPGKVEAWRAFAAELSGPRAHDFADLNFRHGLTHHKAYLQQNPDGSYLVIAIHEGPGAGTFLEKAGASDHPVDVWFREQLGNIHGMDLSAPPGPAPELLIDAVYDFPST